MEQCQLEPATLLCCWWLISLFLKQFLFLLLTCQIKFDFPEYWWLIWSIDDDAKKAEKLCKPWQMGTHLIELSETFPMNTNMAGFKRFSYFFAFLYIGRKWSQHHKDNVIQDILGKKE